MLRPQVSSLYNRVIVWKPIRQDIILWFSIQLEKNEYLQPPSVRQGGRNLQLNLATPDDNTPEMRPLTTHVLPYNLKQCCT